MKRLFRNLFAGLLAFFARGVLAKYRPAVVMVTGSVGKTSTKDAVAAALAPFSYVRASEKSYNSEFGVPLTILGAKNPWTSPTAWTRVFMSALALRWLPSIYPRTLVLEVGADRPGDLARILRIVTPDAVVVTELPAMPVHVEAYATPDAVREEEFQPAYALAPGAPLIISSDDAYARALATPLSVRTTSFGYTSPADVHLQKPELLIVDGKPVGMRAKVTIAGEEHVLVVKGAVGEPQVLAPAAGLAAAYALGQDIMKALDGLDQYTPPPGRGTLLNGCNDSILIDESYNASPAAVEEALASLALIKHSIPGTRAISVLGDMLELGRYSQEEHERIGRLAAKKSDVLVTVGPRADAIALAARASGMPDDRIHSFPTSREACTKLKELVQPNDVVMIKGSQSIRTERIVEALLADPADRIHLVRQESQWQRR